MASRPSKALGGWKLSRTNAASFVSRAEVVIVFVGLPRFNAQAGADSITSDGRSQVRDRTPAEKAAYTNLQIDRPM